MNKQGVISLSSLLNKIDQNQKKIIKGICFHQDDEKIKISASVGRLRSLELESILSL